MTLLAPLAILALAAWAAVELTLAHRRHRRAMPTGLSSSVLGRIRCSCGQHIVHADWCRESR